MTTVTIVTIVTIVITLTCPADAFLQGYEGDDDNRDNRDSCHLSPAELGVDVLECLVVRKGF